MVLIEKSPNLLKNSNELSDWSCNPSVGSLPKHFLDIQKDIIIPSSFSINKAPVRELESEEYGVLHNLV